MDSTSETAQPTKKKIIKKIIKRVKVVAKEPESDSSDHEPVHDHEPVSDHDPAPDHDTGPKPVYTSIAVKPREQKVLITNVWTDEDKTRLAQLVRIGMSVPEISRELGKTESSIRFQLKMTVYNSIQDGRIRDMTELIDGTKIPHTGSYKTTNLYHDNKFIDMIAIHNFLKDIVVENTMYENLFKQVRKECLAKLQETSNQS